MDYEVDYRLRWKDKDDGNKEKMLTQDQYEDLLTLSTPYLNQNWYVQW